MSVRGVVFDWEGTLVDNLWPWVSALKTLSEIHGLALVGGDDRVLRRLLIQYGQRDIRPFFADQDKALQLRGQWYALAQEAGPSCVMAETTHMLETLASSGVSLAVASGKSRGGLEAAILAQGWDGLLSPVCSGAVYGAKPGVAMLHHILDLWDLPPESCLMVGDAAVDMMMAKTAQMPRVGVCSGVGSAEELMAYAPVAVLYQVSDLLSLWS